MTEVMTLTTGVSMHWWDATEPIGLAASHFPSKAVQHEGGVFPWSENRQNIKKYNRDIVHSSFNYKGLPSDLNSSASLMEPRHGWHCHILKNSA